LFSALTGFIGRADSAQTGRENKKIARTSFKFYYSTYAACNIILICFDIQHPVEDNPYIFRYP